MRSNNLQMLTIVAKGFGDLLEKVVFVGGTTTELYSDSPSAPQPRPTQDVDCIIKALSYMDYHRIEQLLRVRGFANDHSEGAPLCRWVYQGTVIDVMPIDAHALGFTNEWYPTAFDNAIDYSLDDNFAIRILNVPYFFATKLSAIQSRGMTDLRTSKDLEDIVFVLNNRSTVIKDISIGNIDVTKYIATAFHTLLTHKDFGEALISVLDYGEPVGRKEEIIGVIQSIVQLSEQ